jgi:hypothetical protein
MMRVLLVLFCFVSPLSAQELIDPNKGKPDDKNLVWYDIQLLNIEGKGWKDTLAPFDRFPAKAEKTVPAPVWGLSRHSAGMCVRFMTESSKIHFKWSLTSSSLAMPHMPATGVSGLDLYVRSPKDGKWQWVSVGQPKQQKDNTHSVTMFDGLKECLLYLPLYNGVSSIEIGIPKGKSLSKGPDRPAEHQKPIVFYGTSITQGGCASRPGMVHTAILGRKFERPVINLGFSGNGRMDQSVVDLLAELDPALYVIDCLPNMQAKEITERTIPLVGKLRSKHPETPILLVEDRTYANAPVMEDLKKRNEQSRKALWKEFDKLDSARMPAIYYLSGDKLLGEDGEGTVDGSHPTDLGFQRQADAFAEAISPLLPPPPKRTAIEGFTNQLSYKPGETIRFHLSSQVPKVSMEIVRIGSPDQSMGIHELAGESYPIPANASSQGCKWPASFQLKIPNDWSSGYYVGRLRDPNQKDKVISELFFVVRSANPGKDSKILLQLSTNTYNAYCNWGGYSLYAYNGKFKIQGRRVSFDRPIAGQFNNWELPFVKWAEKEGYKIDYAVNNDLEFHPEELKAYKLILSIGHDEYWSSPMRDHLEKFIKDGGNVAFFSGNTCCWQVRSEDQGRALTCWKQMYPFDPYYAKGDHKLLSSLWSHHLVERPENQLTGVGFLWGGYHKSHGQFMDGKAEFTVHRPDHWLLEGTQLKKGDTFGSKDTIVGYECDGCELEWKDGLPFATHRDGTPKDFTVLATCPARWHPDDCEWYEKWEKGRTGNSVIGMYTNGGTVVTVGTTDWSHGLRGNDPAVIRITKNVLDRLGK